MLRTRRIQDGLSAKHGSSSELVAVDARESFLQKLNGVIEPERKRKIIGAEFIRVFDETASKLGKHAFLAQGTLDPDVIESARPGGGAAHNIKSRHNVGGLPTMLSFQWLEPLRANLDFTVWQYFCVLTPI